MVILHLVFNGPYTDGYAYQENLLPLKHKALGNDVYIFCTTSIFGSDRQVENVEPSKYIDSNGIDITRFEYKNMGSFSKKLRMVKGLYNEISKVSPDIIFVHGVQFWGLRTVLKYKKRKLDVKIYIDNHADYVNSEIKNIRHLFLNKYLYGSIARKFVPYVEKYWGVTPSRMKYLNEVYGIPNEKIGLLVMGGDEEKINRDMRVEIRNKICEKYEIPKDTFLICTGGKIDYKKNIHILMEAVSKLNEVTLMVFGTAVPDFKNQFAQYFKSCNVREVGWVESDKVYDLFIASDLVAFPGTHSVLWEQAVACGVPCVFKYYEGMEHVDVGGNCEFLYNDSKYEIFDVLKKILGDSIFYNSMRNSAEKRGLKEFSYIEIAKRSIG